MAFFRKHKGRASYELFTGYSHYLPGIGGMMMLFLLFILGSLLGSLLSGLFNLAMGPSELVESYSMLIAYPVSFIPPLLYASAQSRRNEIFDTGYALDSNNFGSKGGLVIALTVSLATIAAAFVAEPAATILPDMPAYRSSLGIIAFSFHIRASFRGMAMQRSGSQRIDEQDESCRSDMYICSILRNPAHEPLAGYTCIHPRTAFRICLLQDWIAQAHNADALREQHNGHNLQPHPGI